jgi:hypothetical protein
MLKEDLSIDTTFALPATANNTYVAASKARNTCNTGYHGCSLSPDRSASQPERPALPPLRQAPPPLRQASPTPPTVTPSPACMDPTPTQLHQFRAPPTPPPISVLPTCWRKVLCRTCHKDAHDISYQHCMECHFKENGYPSHYYEM